MTEERTNKNVLVIRFNAIGDIVLTTPVVKTLHSNGYQVHYVVKSSFASLLENNPFIEKVWQLDDDIGELIDGLKTVQFNLIVDLHNNYRSKKISSAINVKSLTLKKERVGMFLLTQFGIGKHHRKPVVERFLQVLDPLGLKAESATPEFYFSQEVSAFTDKLPDAYICIALGTAWKTKTIPSAKLNEIISGLGNLPVVLIGAKADKELCSELSFSSDASITDLVGKCSIEDSASVINGSQVLLTGDTGMMHIAAALGKPVVAVFGSTDPLLGYAPYYPENVKHSIIQNKSLNCRPCTKQGKNACPKGHFKCMLDLDSQEVIDELKSYV